ncbi:calcium-binding protein [Phenylobacterium kunshanense]|uniref:Calcium-binding protein n=1 Tax=Phenylobacterium kunshanense TaxID=1445034 RepID=A0A328B9C4_9CAUL|nr:hypothetical protein [Phenylobacterium kunshanense]RAK63285.1 hypothetical protein DJ019_16260 [Phenylobacterium kunshanense]
MAKPNTVRADDDAPHARRGEHTPLAGKTETGGRRVDPPGQEDNEHSRRPETPPGLDKKHDDDDAPQAETITGTDAGETLAGGAGADSIDGGAGDDTITGGDGADQMAGGAGADTFVVGDVASASDDASDDDGDDADDDDDDDDSDADVDDDDDDDSDDGDDSSESGQGDLDSILDFTTGEDTLDFGQGLTGTEENFATGEAADYEAALAAANAAMADGTVDFVAVQVGGDVIVFADTDGVAGSDTAVVLVGKTLDGVGFGDIG